MRLPSAPAPALDTRDPNALASSLRIARENVEHYSALMERMLDVYAQQQPIFANARRALEAARQKVPVLEQSLKDLARDCRRTLDLRSVCGAEVFFSNPSSKVISPDSLRAAFPTVLDVCPDAIQVVEEVDVKVVETAVAAGVLPEHILSLIKKVPTTKAGKVELKYVDTK